MSQVLQVNARPSHDILFAPAHTIQLANVIRKTHGSLNDVDPCIVIGEDCIKLPLPGRIFRIGTGC